jgi:hypothetical protein
MISAVAGEKFVASLGFDDTHLRIRPREAEAHGVGERRLRPHPSGIDLIMRIDNDRLR